jgi:hypothetical protein
MAEAVGSIPGIEVIAYNYASTGSIRRRHLARRKPKSYALGC